MSTIAVIGLGYVGLPLAVALAEKHDVIGFDIDGKRISELNDGHDRTGEVSPEILDRGRAKWHSNSAAIKGVEFFIITVPTPVVRPQPSGPSNSRG